MMSRRLFAPAALALTAATAMAPVAVYAQFESDSYKFLKAVKDGKGEDVTALLNKPGTTIINTKDRSTGEGALHIIVRRGDEAYLRFFLGQKGVDANIQDKNGDTPLTLAVTLGQDGLAEILAANKNTVNFANNNGETPLILAVHHRDVALARALIAAGADPDQHDHLAGQSARDYANADTRSQAMAKLFADTPKKVRKAVAGPKF